MNKPKILTKKEIKKNLAKLPGWELAGNRIKKTLVFSSFTQGIRLLSQLGPFCDKIDHHPDIHINYKKFLFELTRYHVGEKLTDRDIMVARKIEDLYHKQNEEEEC